MRNARIDMRLPEKQKERWVEYADRHKLDLSELIRRSVDHQIDRGASERREQPKEVVA